MKLAANANTRFALGSLVAFLLLHVLIVILEEWMAYKFGHITDIFIAPFFFITYVAYKASIVFSIIYFTKKLFTPAIVFLCIFFIGSCLSQVGEQYIAAFMNVRGHFFSKYTSFCQHTIDPKKLASICYRFNDSEAGDYKGRIETLVFNSGDEMQLPARQWPIEIKKLLTPFSAEPVEMYECFYEKSTLITSHMYWVESRCWND